MYTSDSRNPSEWTYRFRETLFVDVRLTAKTQPLLASNEIL